MILIVSINQYHPFLLMNYMHDGVTKMNCKFNFALLPPGKHPGMIQPVGLSQVSTHRQPFAVLDRQVHREVEGALLS